MLNVGVHNALERFPLCKSAAHVGRADVFNRALCAYHFGAETRIVRGIPIRHVQFVIKIVLISPNELRVPDYIKTDVLDRNGIPYEETTDLLSVMPELDILYMTRVQRERFFNEEDYLRLKDSYILTPDKLKGAKADLSILHPLPRVNEIAVAIDNDPRACYFKQVFNGKIMRMALIMKLLEVTV